MDSLKELAGREMAVLQRAHAAVGLIEEKEVLLREAGVYSASASIHAAYIALTAPPESNPEALKRAVFLGWYDDAEPGWITGVEDLPSDQVRQALELLDSARLGGRIDGARRVVDG
ncbi:MAG: hypothetical protein M1565_02025, partial [Actinobacteria bacterium]|nr:hypothetical protein [Actinomycetota bacterium]